ncbi:hypothetical protein [Microbacterium sp.]|uniref:hypothetical protein n=1 Tax=Microbacterium sp. TaxID=51671 RepID=UPI0039E6BFE4
MTHRPRKNTAASVIVALCLTLVLAGCGSDPSPTCAEYLATPLTERGQLNLDLLRKHDLEWTDQGNIVGVSAAVERFCADASNEDRSLDEAADWTADTW